MSKVEETKTAFALCGVSFLQDVKTPNGRGLVQGITRKEDGSLAVIVSHDPSVLPPEMVPTPCKWKLCYYDPEEIKPWN